MKSNRNESPRHELILARPLIGSSGRKGSVYRSQSARRSEECFAGEKRDSVFALGVGDALDLFAEESEVERLLEDIVEAVLSELLGSGFIFAGQSHDQGGCVGFILTQVRCDLDRLGSAQAQIDDDRVRVEAAGENAGLEAAIGHFELVIVVFGKKFLDPVVEQLFSADQQDLVPFFFFEFPQRHSVFLEETNELLAGDAAILAAGDTISLQTPGIEPLRYRAWGNLAHLGHLSGGEHLFHCEALRLLQCGHGWETVHTPLGGTDCSPCSSRSYVDHDECTVGEPGMSTDPSRSTASASLQPRLVSRRGRREAFAEANQPFGLGRGTGRVHPVPLKTSTLPVSTRPTTQLLQDRRKREVSEGRVH